MCNDESVQQAEQPDKRFGGIYKYVAHNFLAGEGYWIGRMTLLKTMWASHEIHQMKAKW